MSDEINSFDYPTPLEQILRGGHIGRVESDACKSIGIIVADMEGLIVYANDKITSLFHYAPRELIGQKLSVLMGEEAGERHDRWFRQWWDEGRPMREMSARQRIVGIDRNGQDVGLVITISETRWVERPAALATLLPSSWIGTHETKTSVVAVETVTSEE